MVWRLLMIIITSSVINAENVDILSGDVLMLHPKISVPSDNVKWCYWQHADNDQAGWDQFIGQDCEKTERLNISSGHQGWGFLGGVCCLGGLWRRNMTQRHAGNYQLYVIGFDTTQYPSEVISVTVTQPLPTQVTMMTVPAKKNCPTPPQLTFGKLLDVGLIDLAVYTCKDGYEFTDIGEKAVHSVCSESGTWNPVPDCTHSEFAISNETIYFHEREPADEYDSGWIIALSLLAIICLCLIIFLIVLRCIPNVRQRLHQTRREKIGQSKMAMADEIKQLKSKINTMLADTDLLQVYEVERTNQLNLLMKAMGIEPNTVCVPKETYVMKFIEGQRHSDQSEDGTETNELLVVKISGSTDHCPNDAVRKEALTEHKDLMDAANDRREKLDDSIKEMNDKIFSLEDQNTQLDTKMKAKEEYLDTHRKRSRQLETEKKELEEELSALKKTQEKNTSSGNHRTGSSVNQPYLPKSTLDGNSNLPRTTDDYSKPYITRSEPYNSRSEPYYNTRSNSKYGPSDYKPTPAWRH